MLILRRHVRPRIQKQSHCPLDTKLHSFMQRCLPAVVLCRHVRPRVQQQLYHPLVTLVRSDAVTPVRCEMKSCTCIVALRLQIRTASDQPPHHLKLLTDDRLDQWSLGHLSHVAPEQERVVRGQLLLSR